MSAGKTQNEDNFSTSSTESKAYSMMAPFSANCKESFANISPDSIANYESEFLRIEYYCNVIMIFETLACVGNYLPETNASRQNISKKLEISKMKFKFLVLTNILVIVDLSLVLFYLLGTFLYKHISNELTHIVNHLSVIHVFTSFILLNLYSNGLKKAKKIIKGTKQIEVTQLSHVSLQVNEAETDAHFAASNLHNETESD
ncbi:hypothetical protein HK099_007839 [Clydaea vesicula]|uniref:Uncharacterized protein n=1 Tax=Clydaea vesicula TaxID=447962 RepID=A0AAD5UBW6_9FUNG|nr:hypothetical protein HK099_007839 [Clydaea vesicula]